MEEEESFILICDLRVREYLGVLFFVVLNRYLQHQEERSKEEDSLSLNFFFFKQS